MFEKRDQIIEENKGNDYTHALTRDTWHGYTRKAGHLVIACPELDNYFIGEGITNPEIKDNHGCSSHWVIDENGDILNVWNCEIRAVIA